MQCSLRDMSIFVAAYEERSFTAAAQRENATQSGVSQHMQNLEHTLGVQLFIRERGGVRPTPAAASFYASCLQVLRAHAVARSDVARFAKSEVGEVRIGLMPTVTSRVLSPALDAFMRAAPNVLVRIVEGYSATLTQMVQAGELDCAIVPSSPIPQGLRSRFFVRTLETLVSRPASGLQHLAPVRLAELGPLRMALPSPSNARRPMIEAYCADNGIEIAQVVELDAMLGTLDFVAQTDWVTILPAIMMHEEGGQRPLTVNPVTGPDLHVDLIMVEPVRRPMSPQAVGFVERLEAEARRIAAGWEAHRHPRPLPERSKPRPAASLRASA